MNTFSKKSEKEKKAIRILQENGIDECCQWLLKLRNADALSAVQGVVSVKLQYEKYCKFSYNGASYELFYENFRESMLEDDYDKYGDFRINVDSDDVLLANVTKEYGDIYDYGSSISCRIYLEHLRKALLGNWVKDIPLIVSSAKEIYEKQEKEKEKKEEKKRAEEMDKNIDLGEYE